MAEGTSYFDTLSSADPESQLIVFGFIRRIEVLLVNQMNIPSEIVSICLLYYWDGEYFTKHGPHMILSDNYTTVVHDEHGYSDDVQDSDYCSDSSMDEYPGNTAYGNLEINKVDFLNCIWKFKINKLDKN
eukprot:358825_1